MCVRGFAHGCRCVRGFACGCTRMHACKHTQRVRTHLQAGAQVARRRARRADAEPLQRPFAGQFMSSQIRAVHRTERIKVLIRQSTN